jgi:hypothetical protein
MKESVAAYDLDQKKIDEEFKEKYPVVFITINLFLESLMPNPELLRYVIKKSISLL